MTTIIYSVYATFSLKCMKFISHPFDISSKKCNLSKPAHE